MVIQFRRVLPISGTLAIAFISSCKVGPDYARPAMTAPPAFRGSDDSAVFSEGRPSLGDEQWSAVYRQPELQQLIRKALANNYDLRIAAQRILEQQAEVRIVRSQAFPTASIGSSLSKQSGDLPIEGSFNISAAWTPDFWGLYRRQTEAARAQLLGQVWAQRAVRLTLVQQVASVYIQLRAFDYELEVTRQTIEVRQHSLELTKTLQKGGSVPLSDVRQAEQLLLTAKSEVPLIEEQIQQLENSLSLLLGEAPGPFAHADTTALAPPPQDLPVGLPSQLLERRPDIQQAESALIAANAQIGVARAQFFPSISMSASGAITGDSLYRVFDASGRTASGTGSLTQPIFAGGKLRGQLALSQATKEELLLSYHKTILQAFRDVSNALIALNKERAYREQQEQLVASAGDSVRLARIRYQGGSTSYLEVLTNDSNFYAAQLNLVAAQQNEALAMVQLYSALGGGWQN